MSDSVRVVWDDGLIGYDFGPGHPLAPVRVELTMALADELGVLDRVEVAGCEPATDDDLALVHDRGYIEAVKRVSRYGEPDLRHGLGTVDNPAFCGVHEASALVAGATLAAAKAVWTGEVQHALNVAGGLRVVEPAADLAVAAALLSSLADSPAPERTVFFGEVSLAGEVRPVSQAESRLKEAAKLGFEHAVMPAGAKNKVKGIGTSELMRLNELVELFPAARAAAKRAAAGRERASWAGEE
mgnify:CR=1 FL=1